MIYEMAQWISDSALGIFVSESPTAFPWLETIHVIAISLVFGCILIVDLRIVGMASMQHAASKISNSLLPLTWIMFAIALITGIGMFANAGVRYLETTAFVIKMLLILLAGINMLIFHRGAYAAVVNWDETTDIPNAARIAGLISIACWVGVVITGRFIGFTITHF